MTYLSGQAIGGDVLKLQPNHVMVAYLGVDWRTFLPNIEDVERLVVQPNPPTNPQALRDIIKIIGWDKVRFLDNLHAKVYVRLNPDGKGKAIVGSPNLTANGLGGSGLYEAAVRFDFDVTKAGSPGGLLASFDTVWDKAGAQYPDEASKESRLERLVEDSKKYWGKGVSHINTHPDTGKIPSICDYGSEWKMDFWPVSYAQGDVKFKGDALKAQKAGRFKELFACVCNDDQIVLDKTCERWILQWRITNQGLPYQRTHLSWLYIHNVFPNSVVSQAPYSSVLIEANDRGPRPNPPFELDQKTEKAIKDVLCRPEYKAFWEQPTDGTGWKTQDINDLMSAWLADVIKERGCP